MTIEVPKLSERSEDMNVVHHFLRKYQKLMNQPIEGISDGA